MYIYMYFILYFIIMKPFCVCIFFLFQVTTHLVTLFKISGKYCHFTHAALKGIHHTWICASVRLIYVYIYLCVRVLLKPILLSLVILTIKLSTSLANWLRESLKKKGKCEKLFIVQEKKNFLLKLALSCYSCIAVP